MAGGLAGCGSDTSEPVSGPPPAHHTTPGITPSTSARPAVAHAVDLAGVRRVVRDPRARLEGFVAVPGHPERRIAEWAVCPDQACHRPTYALVVTGDGFATSHLVGVGTSRVANGWCLEPAGPDHFAISANCGRRRLVGLSGHVRPVDVSGRAGPLSGREVPLRSARTGYEAVDPATGVAHPLSTPAGTVELLAAPGGQLRVATVHWRYAWSGDGGATWQQIPMPAPGRGLMIGLVPTTSASLQAVQLGGDGATLLPWDYVLRSTDGSSWTSYAGPGTPHAYGSMTAVLPDGRLLMDVDAWSDQRAGRPAPRPINLYSGPRWDRLTPVPLTGPFAVEDPDSFYLDLLDVTATTDAVTLYARAPAEDGVLSSTDGGRTWHPVRAR
ncbi:MAG TPA: hypothetical protein VHW64_17925 [Nocardioides sp.]|jgi:hypothetical protein|uniref:hypothetical protein n=1 Tax=Nocardioides sp. TaxID=35761 RepID=UPI002E309443|nr:hypothetical protein [Nocardioides sp.]HEX3932579.1 hypothetical protein [Nocardioides sp.]